MLCCYVGAVRLLLRLVVVVFQTENALPAEQQDFVRELEVMKAVKKMGQHINIVNFLGCSTQGGWCLCVLVCVRVC